MPLAIVTGPLHITVVHLVHDLTDNLSRSVVPTHPTAAVRLLY